jgi:hypothetical protein
MAAELRPPIYDEIDKLTKAEFVEGDVYAPFHIERFLKFKDSEESVCDAVFELSEFNINPNSPKVVPENWRKTLKDFIEKEVVDVFPFPIKKGLERRLNFMVNEDKAMDLALMRCIQLLQCLMFANKKRLNDVWYRCLVDPQGQTELELAEKYYNAKLSKELVATIASKMVFTDKIPIYFPKMEFILTIKRPRSRIAFDCSFSRVLRVCNISPSYIQKLAQYIMALRASSGISDDPYFPVGAITAESWEEIYFYQPSHEWHCLPQITPQVIEEILDMLKVTGLTLQITRYSCSEAELSEVLVYPLREALPNLERRFTLRENKRREGKRVRK